MAKQTNIISLTKYRQPAPVAKPPSPKLTDLSFVIAKYERTGKSGRRRQCGFNYWSVAPTGSYGSDCDIGSNLALQYLKFVQRMMFPLQDIVRDMPKDKLTGIEIGFLSTVSTVTAIGASTASDALLEEYVAYKNDWRSRI